MSKDYRVKFEMFGKKMVTNITAESKLDILAILSKKIIIHDVQEVPKIDPVDKELFENLKDIFNIK